LPELDYPFHDKTVTVTTCGRICFNRQKINLSTVFAGQKVGIRQVSEQIWLVSFMDYDLGYFDDETCRLEPLENPFGPKVLAPVVTSESSYRTSEAAREARPPSAVASERLR
jgi:putative transposase